MSTPTWVIVVSVLVSIPPVSLLGYVLNRSYQKRRSLTETEQDLEADQDRSSNTLINEAQPSLHSENDLEADQDPSSNPLINEAPSSLCSKKDLEVGQDRSSNPLINEAHPPLQPEKDLRADRGRPLYSSINKEPSSLYSPEEALQNLVAYQRYHRRRRPDNGESFAFHTSPFGTIVKYVPCKFSALPGANNSFSFEPSHEFDPRSNSPPPTPLSTPTISDFGSEDSLALRQRGSSTARESGLVQSTEPLRRNGAPREVLQNPRKSMPRAPRKEIGSENRLQEVKMVPVNMRVRDNSGNGGLRRMDREVDLRGRMLKVN